MTPCDKHTGAVVFAEERLVFSQPRWSFRRSVLLTSVLMLLSGTAFSADDVDYIRDIKPLLKAKCWSCHGALKQEANLRLDTVGSLLRGGDSGPAIVSGDPVHSELIRRVMATDESERMPPEGEPVSIEQVERLKIWLNFGVEVMADEKPQTNPTAHWAFQPLNSLVDVGDERSAGEHSIDDYVDQKLKDVGLQRCIPADAVVLVRRMFLDLHGLPPTVQQVTHWQSVFAEATRLGPAAELSARRQLIDELLASDRYGERWGQHWLDVVRYADTHGFEVNTPRANAWPYRDYVIEAFNSDKPYDRFVFEQLAGDTVEEDSATGFLVAAAALLPGQIGKDEQSIRLARQDALDEIIVGTSATFLGMTVGCARCHDHKFDPIPQADYYALQAFFAGVEYGEREIKGPKYQEKTAEANALQPQIEALLQQLDKFSARAFTGRTIIVDDEDLDRVTLLAKSNGYGVNPDGAGQGYKNDVGDESRISNLSQGRYTWFDSNAGQDVFTWNPAADGEFRLWISWGVHGSGVHTRDARYILDVDGDLATTVDQTEIAVADQYYFAGQTEGESEQQPLWSGLQDAGVHRFNANTRLILRCGNTGTGITADVVVLQQSDAALPLIRGPVNAAKNVERISPVEAKFVRFTSEQTIDNDKHEPCIDELEVFAVGTGSTNIAAAKNGTVVTSSGNYSETGKHQLQHVNDGRYGNSFSWISNQHGKGWVQVEFAKPATIDRIEWGRDREGKFQDRLPVNYQISTSLDGVNWTLVASSADRAPLGSPFDEMKSLLRSSEDVGDLNLPSLAKKLQQLEKRQADLRTRDMVFAGTFREPDKTFVLLRGDPEQPTTEIAPHVLTSISDVKLPPDSSDRQRREALANWIVSPKNPLTARVIVNRVWQYHFGVGLVETSSDFGLNGATPSHPKLLDWLAQEFINSGWSIKQLHRLIMTSETYCQAAIQSDAGNAVDAGNRLLWHFPNRRLEAESIRDSILAISGNLNLKQGGPGFNFFKTRGGLSGFPEVEEFTSNELRRMIYAHKIRMEPVPIFGAFDCPDAGLPTPRRSQSTTAIQALNLFNSSFVIDQAEQLAKRCEEEAGPKVFDQIQLAFQLVVGRSPSAVEIDAITEIVQQHGLATLCRALFNSNEFLFIP